jgi:hypothetical protein
MEIKIRIVIPTKTAFKPESIGSESFFRKRARAIVVVALKGIALEKKQ